MEPNLVTATPVLHVSISREAEAYYCGQLGLTKQWEYRPASPASDPAYLGLARDGAQLHISSFSGDGVAGGAVAFTVRDIDALYTELVAQGVAIQLPPTDQTWGNREMYLRDPDNNSLRFLQGK